MPEENENHPPKPTTKTSAVPLKKETVRITLRPNAPGSDAPPATVPLSPPPRPNMGGAPPAPTISMPGPPRPNMGGAPPAPSAPTAPGAPPRPAPPVSPVGSKTIPLGASPPRAAAPGMARPPAAAPAAGGGTQPLPRATIKLPSAAPTAAISSAPVRSAMHDEDEEGSDGTLNILGWVALVASLATLLFAAASVDDWPLANGFATAPSQVKSWEENNDIPNQKLPVDYSPFDTKSGEGILSSYETKAPKIPAPPSFE